MFYRDLGVMGYSWVGYLKEVRAGVELNSSSHNRSCCVKQDLFKDSLI